MINLEILNKYQRLEEKMCSKIDIQISIIRLIRVNVNSASIVYSKYESYDKKNWSQVQ